MIVLVARLGNLASDYQIETILATTCISSVSVDDEIDSDPFLQRNASREPRIGHSSFAEPFFYLFVAPIIRELRLLPTPSANCTACNRFNLFLTSNQESMTEWATSNSLCEMCDQSAMATLCRADLCDNKMPFTSVMRHAFSHTCFRFHLCMCTAMENNRRRSWKRARTLNCVPTQKQNRKSFIWFHMIAVNSNLSRLSELQLIRKSPNYERNCHALIFDPVEPAVS